MPENLTAKQTVVEEGTEFDGSFRSQGPISVSGSLRGDISAPSLTIARSGSVRGQIKVTELKSEGEIAGDIEADSVELAGHVSDQTTIRASSLQVRLNQNGTAGKLQVTFGSCDLQVGNPALSSHGGSPKLIPGEHTKKKQAKDEAALPHARDISPAAIES
jgi:cytoskeletal protein CcmA (bactofilin family)